MKGYEQNIPGKHGSIHVKKCKQKDREKLIEFADKLEWAMSNGRPLRISNDSKEHAIIFIEKSLQYAKKSIYLLCNSLRTEVYGERKIIDSFAGALARGIKINILIQKEKPNEEIDCFYKMLSFWKNQISFKTVNHINFFSNRDNYMIVDCLFMRSENDQENLKAEVYINESKKLIFKKLLKFLPMKFQGKSISQRYLTYNFQNKPISQEYVTSVD